MFTESIAKKRANTTEELALIESEFRSGATTSNRQSKNGNSHEDESHDNHHASIKHNRRSSMDEDEDEDPDDSLFNQSDYPDQTIFDNSMVKPDLSLLKTENEESHVNSLECAKSEDVQETTDNTHDSVGTTIEEQEQQPTTETTG